MSGASGHRVVYKIVDRGLALVGAGAVGWFGDCVSEFPCLANLYHVNILASDSIPS